MSLPSLNKVIYFLYALVVHTTAKQVISLRRKNENVFKMSKDEKCTCKACKNTVFHCQICKFVSFSLIGKNGFHVKAENESFTAGSDISGNGRN